MSSNDRPNATSPRLQVMGFYRPHDPSLGSISFIGEKSLAHQSFKDECDINMLMKKYGNERLIPHVQRHQGQYGDFTAVVDYQTAQHVVAQAEEMFLTLPSKIREEFDNDPGAFLDFATDANNVDKLIEMGLATERNKPIDPAAPPAEQAATPAAAGLSPAPAPSPKAPAG